MELDLFYDTETSGFPTNKIPMNDKENAWIVQLGYILGTEDHIYLQGNLIVQSEGRSINPHALKVHGITTEKCDKLGLNENSVVFQFHNAISNATNIICHNESFDAKMLKLLFARQVIEICKGDKTIEEVVNTTMKGNYYDKNVICTMEASTNFCKLPGRYGKYKWPKLEELYKILFHKKFVGAHDALSDVKATRRCYYELKRRGVI